MDELVAWLRRQIDQDDLVVADMDAQFGDLIGTRERAVAEIDAKRRILEMHEPVVLGAQDSWTWFQGSEAGSEAALRLLALPYAGREGYRPEWKP